MEAVFVSVDLIRISPKRQKGISARRVEELRRRIENDGNVFPVRLCALGDGTYIVEDGRHRIQAYKNAGYTFILAVVENLRRIQHTITQLLRKILRAL